MNDRILKRYSLLSDAGLLVIGVFFAVLSILLLRAPQTRTAVGQAVITDIFSEYDTIDEETTYDVRVAYSVDGMRFTDVPYGSYHTGMKPGDTVEIRYDPADPSDIAAPGTDKIPYVTLVIGIAAAAFGLFRLLRRHSADAPDEPMVPEELTAETSLPGADGSDADGR